MTVSVCTKSGKYDVVIGRGILNTVGTRFSLNRKVLVVTDTGVPSAYADTVLRQCASPYLFAVPAGEASKNIESLTEILRKLSEENFTRYDAVVAVGGGMVSDLAGFAAATYLRGIDFYVIPTTLLSMADASVGGKNGINFSGIKNRIGTFRQPKGVLIDTETLKTLDKRIFSEGMAEIIKMAATGDEGLFSRLERGITEADYEEILERAVSYKKRIVEADETEEGLRRVLNFGHTIGHAVESLEEGRYLHGECVAIGMLPMAEGEAKGRIQRVLLRYGLPTGWRGDGQALREAVMKDKKAEGDRIHAVLVRRIGEAVWAELTPAEIIGRWENER